MAPAGLPGLVKQQHHSGGVRSGRVTKKHYRKPEQHLDPKKWHIKYEEIEHPYGLLIEIVPWDRNVDGYTRVALGHDIISPCRQECIKERRKVYALRWECDNGQPRDLRDPETYLDRRGFLFPTDVVNSVMEEILSAGNVLKPLEEEKIIQNYDESKILQEMKEQFPNLDDMRVQAIYHHAWDTRFPDRVGHAFDLSVQRKVQKATWAHVRHNFTNYDSHYKYQDSRTYARGEVEMKCIKLMHELRGEIMEAPLSQWKEIVDLTKSDDETDDEIEVISALNLSPFNISPKQIANSTVYNNVSEITFLTWKHPKLSNNPTEAGRPSYCPRKASRKARRKARHRRQSSNPSIPTHQQAHRQQSAKWPARATGQLRNGSHRPKYLHARISNFSSNPGSLRQRRFRPVNGHIPHRRTATIPPSPPIHHPRANQGRGANHSLPSVVAWEPGRAAANQRCEGAPGIGATIGILKELRI